MFLANDPCRQQGLFALLPQIKKAVTKPVIAAGGIATAAHAKAAKILGADGVQIGTALLFADESVITPAHRRALQTADFDSTALTNLYSGGYARRLSTPLMQELGAINPAAPAFPLAGNAITALKQADAAHFSSLWAGQNAPLCEKSGSAAAIITAIAAGFC